MKRNLLVVILMIALLMALVSYANADELSIQAQFRQSNPVAGEQLDLSWSVTGGSGIYSDIQIVWELQSSCLCKTLDPIHRSGSSGTTDITPGDYVDQVEVTVTATDSNGNTGSTRLHTELSNWQHENEAWFDVMNDINYADAGQQVSASWEIGAGRHTISDVRYQWVVLHKTNDGMITLDPLTGWTNVGTDLTGSATYTPNQAGIIYLNVIFDAEDGWACPGGIFDPIQVLNPGDTPVTAEISFSPTKAKAGDPITIGWSTAGTKQNTNISVDWYFCGDSGNETSDVVDPAGTLGTTTFTPSEDGDLDVSIAVYDPDTGLRFRKYNSMRVGDEPIPHSNIMIQASFQQPSYTAGQTLNLDWSVSGGSGIYSDVQIDWVIQESCLSKTMHTDHSTAASGTTSYTPPTNPDQVMAKITVTDSNGSKRESQCRTNLTNYQRDNPASFSVFNDVDYVQVDQNISARWNIEPGRHTISNVHYRWVTVYRNDQGRIEERMTGWTDAGNNLTGRATYTTTQAGNVYLDVAFDAEEGWACSGGRFEPIQVLNAGETPVTAGISITPEEPKTGEDFKVTWNTEGTTANTEIEVQWEFFPQSGSPSTNTIHPTTATGSTTLKMTDEGWLNAKIQVRDNDKNIQLTRRVSAEIKEPSGITLAVTPQNPTLGQPVTINWDISRASYEDADLEIELYTGNLVKCESIQGADLKNNQTGSVTFIPTEGDSFKVCGHIWTSTKSFEEETAIIPLTGTWKAPNPYNVSVSYQVLQTRAVTGPRIVADYSITGGTGNISSIYAYWYRFEPDGRKVKLHERELDSPTGQIIYTPSQSGDYALVFEIADWESGWSFYQNPSTITSTATVTGISQTDPGIEFIELPTVIDPGQRNMITWDVTGGDNSGNRNTTIYIETDDGIILTDSMENGFTISYEIPAWNVGEDSKSITIELTPEDNSTAGETVTKSIPIVRSIAGRLILPRGLKKIESEAFLNTAADEIDIPDSVEEIGENAFPSGVTLIVGEGTDAETWARNNGYTHVVREEGPVVE